MPLSLTLLASAVPEKMRAAAIGIWGGVSGLGVALGPVVGGAVVEGVSWQAIFWLNVPVAVVALPLLLFAVRESKGTWQRLDLVGTAMLGGAVFLGIWGIVHGNDDGWTSAGVLVPLVVAGLLVPAYVAWARGRSYAVLPLRLFSARGFSVANVIGLTFTIGMFGTVFLLSQYLQVVQGYSPLEAGIRTLPWTAAPMVVAPIAGAIAGRTGLRKLLVTGLTLQTASLVWFAWLTENGSAYSAFVVPLAMAGIGMGLTFAPSATAVLRGAAGQRLRHRQLGQLDDPRVRRGARHRAAGRGLPRQRWRDQPGRVRRGDRPGAAHRRRRGGRRRGRSPLRPREGAQPRPDPAEPARRTQVRRPPRRTCVVSP